MTTGHETIEVVDVPEPTLPGPGQLLVRPEAVGLCGSDFHYYHGHLPGMRYPRIQGHEFSAIVETAGDAEAEGFTPGQRVAVWPVSACGACYACRIGRENACERINLIGIHRDGALQERLTVPAAQAFPVDGLSARLTAFVEPTSICLSGCAVWLDEASRPLPGGPARAFNATSGGAQTCGTLPSCARSCAERSEPGVQRSPLRVTGESV